MNTADARARTTPWRRATPSGSDPTPELASAFDRVLSFFADRSTRPAVLARMMLGRPSSGDALVTEHLIRERRRQTRMDGSIHGSLLKTVKTLSELLDLACPPDHAAVVRTVGYVLSRQNAPGPYAEGCQPTRHAAGECRHALQGLFSPATRDDEFTNLRFPNGLVVADEDDALFAASCYALRVVLRAREDRRATVQRHVESLIGLGSLWDLDNDRWPPAVRLLALAALGVAPYEYRADTERCASSWIEAQADDGTWAGTDLIPSLDALMGFTMPDASGAIRRGTATLLAQQREDGSFSLDSDEETTLMALRILLRTVT